MYNYRVWSWAGPKTLSLIGGENVIQAGIIGATGYTGAELVRLLCMHPEVQIQLISSRSHAGKRLAELYPNLNGYVDLICEPEATLEMLCGCDVVFIALPAGHAATIVKGIASWQAKVGQDAGGLAPKVIDLGADFRLRDPQAYQGWYGMTHEAPEFLSRSVYGLPEIHRDKIAHADLIANPGCYPTATILGLLPGLREGILDLDSIIVDAKSGVSGAGRELRLSSHYVEVNEGIHPYQAGRHRHTPEIEQELEALAGRSLTITFTPHLVPMSRGILATIYAQLKEPIGSKELWEIYYLHYQDEPFIQVLPEGHWPHTRWTYGSNMVLVGLTVDQRTQRAIIAVAIDNLGKGASGQAVQNMNIMFGLPETTGLLMPGLVP